MTYSLDLRNRVVKFVNNGGSKVEGSRRYDVGRDTVYRWLSREFTKPKQILTRKRKLDTSLLIKRVKNFPEDRLIDHAKVFNVDITAIFYQFKMV